MYNNRGLWRVLTISKVSNWAILVELALLKDDVVSFPKNDEELVQLHVFLNGQVLLCFLKKAHERNVTTSHFPKSLLKVQSCNSSSSLVLGDDVEDEERDTHLRGGGFMERSGVWWWNRANKWQAMMPPAHWWTLCHGGSFSLLNKILKRFQILCKKTFQKYVWRTETQCHSSQAASPRVTSTPGSWNMLPKCVTRYFMELDRSVMHQNFKAKIFERTQAAFGLFVYKGIELKVILGMWGGMSHTVIMNQVGKDAQWQHPSGL